jgi:hypothetical protein
MKIQNKTKGALTIKGIRVEPDEIKDIPGLTVPDIKATHLKTWVKIINDKPSSPPKRAAPQAKPKEKGKVSRSKPKTLLKLNEEPGKSKVIGCLDREGNIERYDVPKEIEDIENMEK